jgi:predicted Zn-dependent peptidase
VVTEDPEPVGQKRFVAIRDNARPSLDILFPVPAIQDSLSPAFEILEGVLSGASGRLEPVLVDSLRLVTEAGGYHRAQVYAGMFYVGASPVAGSDPAQIEKELWKQVERLRDSLLSPRELERVKNRVAASRIAKLRDMENLATELGFFSLYGDWTLVNRYPKAVQAVTAEQVRQAAQKFLRPERATVGWLLPRSHSEHTRTGVYQ